MKSIIFCTVLLAASIAFADDHAAPTTENAAPAGEAHEAGHKMKHKMMKKKMKMEKKHKEHMDGAAEHAPEATH